MSGKHYGRYLLESRIAMGGMAEIFCARTRTEGFEKRVCIKRILPHFLENEEFVTMFRDEARTAARLQHANVVQVFDFGEEEGTLFLAMEFVDGSDLRRLLDTARKQKLPLDVGAALQIAIDMCKGLHHAHTLKDGARPLGIVHRDVSPHNVMISRAGEVKVTDFGIARAAERATHTSTGMVKGKIAYMAPEHAQGLAFDHRLDQFATGVVLWEMLTGVRLFSGDNDAMTLKKVLACQVPAPSSIRKDVPASVDDIVLRVLKEPPTERFADMRQLEVALQRVLFSGAVDPATADVRSAFERIMADQPEPARKTSVITSDSLKEVQAPAPSGRSPAIEGLPPPALTESRSGAGERLPTTEPSGGPAGGVSMVFASSGKSQVAPGAQPGGVAAGGPARVLTEVEAHGPDPNARTVHEDDPRELAQVASPIARVEQGQPSHGGRAPMSAPPAAVTATATPSARRAATSEELPLPRVSELERLEEAAREPKRDGTPATATAVPRLAGERQPPTVALVPDGVVAMTAPGALPGEASVAGAAAARGRLPGRAVAAALSVLATVGALALFMANRRDHEQQGKSVQLEHQEGPAQPQAGASVTSRTPPVFAEPPPASVAMPVVPEPAPPPAAPVAAPAPTTAATPAPATAPAPTPAADVAGADASKARGHPKGKVVDVLVRTPRYSGFLYVGRERLEVSPQGNVYRLPVGTLSVRVQRGDGPTKASRVTVEPGKPTLVDLE